MTEFEPPKDCVINTFKFEKPSKKVENNFESKYRFSDEERLKILCQKIDQGIIPEFERDFYKEANEFIMEKGKSKLKTRNTKALKNNSEKIDQYTEQNLLEISPGRFKLMTAVIENHMVSALVDSGASNSLINRAVLEQLGLNWEPKKMVVSCATNQKDENNVCGVTSLKLKLKLKNDEYTNAKVKLLVLKNTNDFMMIIGADVLFKDKDFEINENYWSFKDKRKNLVQVELRNMSGKDEKNTLEKMNRIKIASRQELELNNTWIKENKNSNNIKQHPSEKDVESEFEAFLQTDLPKQNIDYKNQPPTGFDTEQEVRENFPQLLLQDNYAENCLDSSMTDLSKDSQYIHEKYTIDSIKIDQIDSIWRFSCKSMQKI